MSKLTHTKLLVPQYNGLDESDVLSNKPIWIVEYKSVNKWSWEYLSVANIVLVVTKVTKQMNFGFIQF